MGKIDTSEWKEFKLGYIMVGNKKQGHGLFEIVNSVAYHGKDVTETDSDDGINYITRSKFNNGLKAKVVCLDKFKVNPAGTISFGAENADFFYQTEPYITGNKMYYIDTVVLSERACRFLKSILEATFTANYSFSDGMIPARIYDECIKLPTTPNGDPDWDYMESYMANLETKVADSLTLLQAAKDVEKKKVDTREWREFRVGELFDAERGKVKNIQPLISGATPIIAAGAYNQGIAGMYEIDSAYKNRITVSCNGAGCGSTFYHPYEFNVNGDAITLVEKKCMPDRAKQFVVCILNATFTRKFSYEEKCSPQKALAEVMQLPIDKTGQPDWAYMEEYMRKVEERVKKTINIFCVIRKIKYDC